MNNIITDNRRLFLQELRSGKYKRGNYRSIKI